MVGRRNWNEPDEPFPVDSSLAEDKTTDGCAETFATATERRGPFATAEEAKKCREELQEREDAKEWEQFDSCNRHWVCRKNKEPALHYFVLAVPYQAATEILWNVDGLYELKTRLSKVRDEVKTLKPPFDQNKIEMAVQEAKAIIEPYDELCCFNRVDPFHGMDKAEREQMFERMRKDPKSTLKELDCFIDQADQARAQALQWLDGDLETLLEFDVEACRRDRNGNRRSRDDDEFSVERDTLGLPSHQFRFPLRDMIGVQYYFREQTRIGRGNFILPRSAWGISGVGQVYVWRRREAKTQGIIGSSRLTSGTHIESTRAKLDDFDNQHGRVAPTSSRRSLGVRSSKQPVKSTRIG